VSKIRQYFSPLTYTIYAIIGTLLEQGALVIIVRWWLPQFDIHISWWVTGILMCLLLMYSFYTYRMGRQALLRKSPVYPDTIIGSEGVVATPLDPTGYVKVKGELWKATSASDMEIGDRIVVTKIDGIRLIVVPESKMRKEPLHNR
jgi:membrane protein implicated in regulation of membrane protease activity